MTPRSAASDPIFAPYLDVWRLTPDVPAIVTHSSQLLPVTRRGQKLMLKVAVAEEEKHGNACLKAWGHGPFMPVHAHQDDAILMTRAEPELDLAQMATTGQDREATSIIVQVTSAIHRAVAPDVALIPLSERFKSLDAAPEGDLFAKARSLADHLLKTPNDQTPLHGDIHHGNILNCGDLGWRAIDPKGVLGECGFDYANVFCNPDPETALAPGRLEARLAHIADEAGLDPHRLRQWGVAWCGLSAVWSLQGGDDPSPALEIGLQAARNL